MTRRRALSEHELMERWANVVSARSRFPALNKRRGDSAPDSMPEPNDDYAVANYVESTPGFAKARPVLRHVYVLGCEASTFVIKLPTDRSRWLAFHRLGWLEHVSIVSDARVCERVLDCFMVQLRARCQSAPYLLPARDLDIE